jgi:2-amino-4-hydroxy-6-hydroxymethyldihydropteridine diphosphokinase
MEKARARGNGRERGDVQWGPRILDLDLLVFSSEKINEPELIIPHPGIGERNFVLLPLGEIAPDLMVPGLGRVASLEYSRSEPRISRIG